MRRAGGGGSAGLTASPHRQLAQGAGSVVENATLATYLASSTTGATRWWAPRPRWPRRASAPASSAGRAPWGERTAQGPGPRAPRRPATAAKRGTVRGCHSATPDRPRAASPSASRASAARPTPLPGTQPPRYDGEATPAHERTDMNNSPTPYPFAWPTGWPRTRAGDRERSRFRKARAVDDQLSMADATSRLFRECRLLGAVNVIVSKNVAVRRDGLALRPPEDAGGSGRRPLTYGGDDVGGAGGSGVGVGQPSRPTQRTRRHDAR